jgi:2-oxoglutarate ferredoxin oxidoreductase subunit alpha
MPILATKTPIDCFETAFEATRIAIQHMTPVILLSDGFIANGAEPWKFPNADDIAPIRVEFKQSLNEGEETLMPYQRDEKLVRPWIIPGTKGLEHRIGGLEKQDITGNISYDPDNHEHMVKTRQAKVDLIANHIPLQDIEVGDDHGDLLVLGWGSTFGVIKTTVNQLRKEGHLVSHAHLRYLRPFPSNLGDLLKGFKRVVIPEINNGQLVQIIRSEYLVNAVSYTKIKGIPITQLELQQFLLSHLQP